MNEQIELIGKLKSQHKVSNQDLATLLGVSTSSIARWMSGSVKISKDKEKILASYNQNPKKFVTALRKSESLKGDKTSENPRREIIVNKKTVAIELEPFVVNAPSDQHSFYEKLIEMQLKSETAESKLLSMSFVAKVNEQQTYISKLTGQKSSAKSWDSNYGSHGWHRYVGRFPPHLVRALINSFNLKEDALIVDPFSGSGTTMVEARLLGYRGIGIEICGLSSLISKTKSKFPTDSKKLIQHVEEFNNFYTKEYNSFVKKSGSKYTHADVIDSSNGLLDAFPNYEKWFIKEALLGVSITLKYIDTIKAPWKELFMVALSSSMRSIGNVDVDVVRAEYSKKPKTNVLVDKIISQKLVKFVSDINEMCSSHPTIGQSSNIQIVNDSLLKADIEAGSVDAIITSPPYGVESISYLRTHLLSYRSLQKFLKTDPYTDNKDIIGSEYLDASKDHAVWTASNHSKTFSQFFEGEVAAITDKKFIFRKNMMMKFFSDMVDTANRFSEWLKPGGKIAFVVGNKKIGDFIIPTHQIIVEVFSTFGLVLEDTICHKLKTNNSNSQVPWQDRIINEEYVLIFKKK